MKLLIGITGKKYSGKDATAKIIQDHFGLNVTAFASKLKQALKIIFCLEDNQLFGDSKTKEIVDPRWGISPREMMQEVGTGIVRNICPDVWVKGVFLDLDKHGLYYPASPGWVISDVRFRDEAQAVRERGGIIIRIIRPEPKITLWKKIKSSIDGSNRYAKHVSEKEIDKIKPDYIIRNDGSLDELEIKVLQLMKQILEIK